MKGHTIRKKLIWESVSNFCVFAFCGTIFALLVSDDINMIGAAVFLIFSLVLLGISVNERAKIAANEEGG